MIKNHPAHRACTALVAAAITAVCAAMAAAAAADRASTAADGAMLTAVAIALVLGAHLLPALAGRSWAGRLLFVGCIVATLYNHAHFFASAQDRAGEKRAAAVVSTGHSRAIAADLQATSARPLSAVSTDLAKAQAHAAHAHAALERCTATAGRCTTAQAQAAATAAQVAALQDERTQALHANTLRTQLASVAAAHDSARASAAADPVDAQIAAATGLSVTTVGLLTALVQSLLLELLAALLWTLALQPASAAAAETTATAEPAQAAQAGTPGAYRGIATAAHTSARRAISAVRNSRIHRVPSNAARAPPAAAAH